MLQGQFIVIEGGDGAGKTTFINFLKEKHPRLVFSREPGVQGLSQKIREIVLSPEAKEADPLAMFHLFWASRAQNMASVVLPALRTGKVVISDRFDASTYAYQIGENPQLEELFWKTRAVCLQDVVPVYLNFDVSIEVAEKRMSTRGGMNHFDLRSDDYRKKVSNLYQKFFATEGVRSVGVNADLPENEMVEHAYHLLLVLLGSTNSNPVL